MTRDTGERWPGLRRVFRLAGTSRATRDAVDAELRFHIEGRIDDLVARGMSRAEAEGYARQRFGDIEAYRREIRAVDARTIRREHRMDLLDTARRESMHALRSLARSPGFTVIAVLTLALGIGAATAIFTLLDRVVLHPLPYPAPGRLVKIGSLVSGKTAAAEWPVSAAGYFYYRQNNRSLSDIGIYVSDVATVTGREGAELVRATGVSASLLHVLGLRLERGRAFTADEDRPNSPPAVILSHAFWERRYAGDPRIVGAAITIDDVPVRVVGVLAPGQSLPQGGGDLWFPLALDPAAGAVNGHVYDAVGRLRDGVTVAAAEADLERLTSRFPQVFPSAYSPAFMEQYHFHVHLTPLRESVVGSVANKLWILLGAVGLVLLIACANVANLLLARIEVRRREVVLRTALGADRVHLAWHYLAESALLAACACAAAIALSYGTIHVLLRLAPSTLPRLAEVRLDWPSVAFAALVSLAIAIVFGLLPLARRTLDLSALRDDARGMTMSGRQRAARNALVIAQVALAVMLVAGAALMLRAFDHLRRVRPGFDPANVLTLQIALPPSTYATHEALTAFHHAIATRIAALPGVVAVGATSMLPLTGGGPCATMSPTEHPPTSNDEASCVPYAMVTPDYFRAMGITVHGRAQDWNHVEHHTAGVVVSRSLAARFWPGENPIGKGIGSEGIYRVVGVTDDVLTTSLEDPPTDIAYYPTTPDSGTFLWSSHMMTVAVRTRTAHPEGLTTAIRRIVSQVDPAVPIASVRTMQDVMASSLNQRSFVMLLLGAAAGMALLLSAVGIYGVISYLVSRRRTEIGIRLALGAQPRQVGRLVVLQSVRVAAIGVLLGTAGALATTRLLRAMLFDVSATDPLTLGAVAALLLAVAALASYVPSRRAARTDPIEALRAE